MRSPVAAALLVLALVGPACSGGDAEGGGDPVGDRSTATTTTPVSDDFPVTIQHMLGETTIEQAPRAIAALGSADFDVALALGAGPVVGVHPTGEPGTLYPWIGDDVDPDDLLLLVDSETPFVSAEAVIAARPDLVLATTAASEEEDWDTYSGQGVPILPPITAPYQDTWQERTLAIGAAVGRTRAAEDLVAETEAVLAAFAADRPGLAGRTFVMANSIGGGQVRAISALTSSSARLLAELGMELPSALTDLDPESDGAVTVSLERLDLLEADVILLTGADDVIGAVTDSPVFQGLSAVERGTVLTYDRDVGTALRLPSPLAIPWVLDQLDEVLTATAAAPAVAGS